MDYGSWAVIKFVNCQSWKDKTLELSTGLNVLEGLNETGKSVFVKCLKLGLNYNSPKFTRKKKRSIVRNWNDPNHKPAQFAIMTTKSYVVMFEFTINSVRTTIITPDEKVRSYDGPARDDAKAILGLVTHGQNSRIMNILDNEEPMLFDGTDNKYNDSVLSNYITHPELKAIYETANSMKTYYQNQIKKHKDEIAKVSEIYKGLPRYGDLDFVNEKVSDLEEYNNRINYNEKLILSLETLSTVKFVQEISMDKLMNNFENILQKRDLIEALSKIYVTNFKYESSVNLSEKYNKIDFKKQLLSRLSECYVLERKTEVDTEDLNMQLQVLKQHDMLIQELADVIKIKQLPFLSKANTNAMNKIILNLNTEKELLRALASHTLRIDELFHTEEEMKKSKEVKEKIENILGICPLCGNSLGGGSHGNCHAN